MFSSSLFCHTRSRNVVRVPNLFLFSFFQLPFFVVFHFSDDNLYIFTLTRPQSSSRNACAGSTLVRPSRVPRASKERQRERRLGTSQIVTFFLYASMEPIFIRVVLVLLRYPPVKASLHGGGGPQVGEVTCGGSPHLRCKSEVTCGGSPHLRCKSDHIKTRDCMDRRVTSPTWGPPPPCKQALSAMIFLWIFTATLLTSTLWVGYLNEISVRPRFI